MSLFIYLFIYLYFGFYCRDYLLFYIIIFDKFCNQQKFEKWLDYLLKSLRLMMSKPQHVETAA